MHDLAIQCQTTEVTESFIIPSSKYRLHGNSSTIDIGLDNLFSLSLQIQTSGLVGSCVDLPLDSMDYGKVFILMFKEHRKYIVFAENTTKLEKHSERAHLLQDSIPPIWLMSAMMLNNSWIQTLIQIITKI